MTTSAEALNRAIDPREFDTPEFERDPFPIYKRLRDHHPIYHDRLHNRWVLSRYDDIVAAFQDNESYDRATYRADGPYEFGTRTPFGPNILEYGNSDRHRWMRNIVADQFVGKKLQTFIPVIEQIAREQIGRFSAKAADDLAKGFAETGEVELVSQFSNQFPVRVISNMLALPREDENTFVRWYQELLGGANAPATVARAYQARGEMWDYLDPIVRERIDNPGEDLVSRIVTAELDGKRMNVDEVKGFVVLLLAAGGDTTDKAISNMWYHMLYTRRDQFDVVKQDPELWTNVFTEMMRYDAVVHVQPRYTTRELVMHGEVIPERASMVLYLAAGNRDDRAFEVPDTFDIFRDDLHMGREIRSGRYSDGKNGHLGFGMGQHFCMGYAMARQEAVIASTRLFETLKNARPKFPANEGITSAGSGFRAPRELWIQFDGA